MVVGLCYIVLINVVVTCKEVQRQKKADVEMHSETYSSNKSQQIVK